MQIEKPTFKPEALPYSKWFVFPFNGKIVTIDQKFFQDLSGLASSGASIPIINYSQMKMENVGVGMYPYLMGTFSCHAPVLMVGYSIGRDSPLSNLVSFHTSHMEDPWILPSRSTSSEPVKTDVSFPVELVVYQDNLDHVVDPSPSSS